MPTIDAVSLDSTNAEEASRFFSKVYGNTRVEPGAGGHFAISVSSCVIDGVSAFSLSSSTGMGLNSFFDGYCLAFSSDSGAIDCGPAAAMDASRGVVLDLGSGAQPRLPENFSAVGMTFTIGEVNRALSQLLDGPVSDRLCFKPPARRAHAYALIREIASTIREGLSGDAPLKASPLAAAHLKDAALNLLLQSVPHSYSERLKAGDTQPSPRHVRRAIDFMHANIARPIALADVVRASGASARSLQSGFRRFKESTPMNYLRQLRLNAVRAQLLDARSRDSIASIAQRWGFTHIGSFSSAYQQAFGELPSETYRTRAHGGGPGD
ncbi:MAG: transcriptional regulator, AraC family [Betaproteobacteria bacterium]|nr:transcriptional regulator, AraC family [Betaproteobacteria bacterium]